jgi:signal transduction histidine kinase
LRLAPEVEINLFHIAQEALANCARHSRASHIQIRQTSCGDEVVLLIGDDGIGFDPANRPAGQGLAMMRRRAQFIGGRFYVDAWPDKGTSIAVRFKTCPNVAWLDAQRAGYASASQARRPRPAAYPAAKQAVNR